MVPPLLGVAVKVSSVPGHAAGGAAMATDGVTEVVVVMVSSSLAVGVLKQEAFEVITTLTLSPSFSVEDLKVAVVAPATSTPFTFHW